MDQLMKLHAPDAKENPRVWEVFSDGEIYIRQGGNDLEHCQRHLWQPGHPCAVIPQHHWPQECHVGHMARILVRDEVDAAKAYHLIFQVL